MNAAGPGSRSRPVGTNRDASGAVASPTRAVFGGTLVAWGGNFAPRTTNNEWWRLVAAMFVHSGRLHLLVNMAALLQIGFLLERLHGGFAVATVYLAAGVFANLLTTSTTPMSVSVGALGPI